MVLIFSENNDGSTNEVIEWLNYFGTKWFRINENDTVSLNALKFCNNKIENFELKVNSEIVDLTQIFSFWYRRGILNWTKLLPATENIVEHHLKQHLKAELKNLDDFVHQYLESTKIGINSFPKSINNKTFYQFAALKEGINIPDTLITTQINEAKQFYAENTKCITKPINEGLGFYDKDMAAYSVTTELSEESFSDIQSEFFPTLIQSYIEKFVELRIFYLHGQFSAMAIFSQQNDKTKLDYRNYDRDNPNRNVPFELPDEIKVKLSNFMNSINLNSGSIDMILTRKNQYVFLEVNPIGQFSMVSRPCNYGLEKTIASYLSYGTI